MRELRSIEVQWLSGDLLIKKKSIAGIKFSDAQVFSLNLGFYLWDG